MSITVLIADDHSVMREGLKILLETQPDITVADMAADGREAVRKAGELRPDIVLMDIAMPGLSGIEAIYHIKDSSPDTKVVILSMHSTPEHIFHALKAGAQGYLLKDSAVEEIIEAVRSVKLGRRYICQKVQELMIDDYMADESSNREKILIAGLSSREKEVLCFVTEGRTSAEIAQLLDLSPKTVETYRSRIMHKLEVKDLAGLMKLVVRSGFTKL